MGRVLTPPVAVEAAELGLDLVKGRIEDVLRPSPLPVRVFDVHEEF
jgi:hypothetical protein